MDRFGWYRYPQTPLPLSEAAEIMALHPLSLVDALIVASATLTKARLVHKDPELRTLKLDQLPLPYKSKRTN